MDLNVSTKSWEPPRSSLLVRPRKCVHASGSERGSERASERERAYVAVAETAASQSGRRRSEAAEGRTDGRTDERSNETAAKKGERRTIDGRRTSFRRSYNECVVKAAAPRAQVMSVMMTSVVSEPSIKF